MLVHPGAEELLDLAAARAAAGLGVRGDVEHCRALRDRPREVVDPPRLLDGNDLIEHGVPPGPEFRRLLQAVRDAQLDGELTTREEALHRVDCLRESPPEDPPG
jgi:poly(A) polymerase